MKSFAMTAAVALAALTASAGAETRNTGAFSSIEAKGRFMVEVTVGPLHSVEVEGPDADEIATRVRGGELVIQPTDSPWFGPDPEFDATIRIVTPRLTGVSASRGAEVTVANAATSDLALDAAMGGIVRAAGTCTRLDASAAMGGMIEAAELTCGNVDASASMGGVIRVAAREGVDASASMGGDIRIDGAPRRRSTSSTMGGAISIR